MKRRRCDSPFSFRSAVPVHVRLCIHTRVRVYVQTERHHGDLFVAPQCRGSSSVNFPRFFLSFPLCHLARHPTPPLAHFVIPLPTPPRGLNEKSEYATIFKWHPRDTLLNALFASPPTSPARPLTLPIIRHPLCVDRRSTILFGRRPDRDEHVSR